MRMNETFAHLTERENTILSQLSQGYANKEIANNLAITVTTVRTHLRHIYGKIQVRSRTEAIVKYLRPALERHATNLTTTVQN